MVVESLAERNRKRRGLMDTEERTPRPPVKENKTSTTKQAKRKRSRSRSRPPDHVKLQSRVKSTPPNVTQPNPSLQLKQTAVVPELSLAAVVKHKESKTKGAAAMTSSSSSDDLAIILR